MIPKFTPKFKVGDLVRCTNPSHPGPRIFNVKVVNITSAGTRYLPKVVMNGKHSHGSTGCRETELELVNEG